MTASEELKIAEGPCPESVADLETILSTPSESVVEMFARLEGHLLMVGAGGKMGPTMVRMAQRAIEQSGSTMQLTAVSRFTNADTQRKLETQGVRTIACDLLQPDQVSQLPDCSHLINLSGFKFGAAAQPEMTWATNCDIPNTLCRRFDDTKIVAFSTGNVYGDVPVHSGGCIESDELRPVGEYAMAALGRERMFQYYCTQLNIPTVLVRLNYATELRYGVLVDIAQSVIDGEPIDLSTGYVNVIWQGDANALALRCLEQTQVPANILNLTGPAVVSVKEVAKRVAEFAEVSVEFKGSENETALLSQAAQNYPQIGTPRFSMETMVRWTTEWIQKGGPTLGKPTKFNVTDGKF